MTHNRYSRKAGRYRPAFLSLLATALLLCAAAPKQSPSIKGVSIGDTENATKQSLLKSASFVREEEGQQVWKLNNDPDAEFLLIGYDADHHVRYVTAVAKPGSTLKCEILGDARQPDKQGKSGTLQFTHPIGDPDDHIIAVARGESRDKLRLCSLKRLGAKSAEEDEEEHEHQSH